jgi:hypothetical protein
MNRTHAFITASLMLASVLTAGAAQAASRDEQTKACRGDAMHFCAADIPNEGKITACMKQHIDELSPGCRAMFKGGKSGSNSGAQ